MRNPFGYYCLRIVTYGCCEMPNYACTVSPGASVSAADTGASAGRDTENTHVTLSVLRSDRTVAVKRNAKRSVLKQGRGCALRPSAGAERIRPRGPSSNFVLFTRMYLSRVKTRSYARYPAEYLQIRPLEGVNVGAKRREGEFVDDC